MQQEQKPAATADSKKFAQMTPVEKAKHIGKVIVFFVSFGFAFPNIFSD